MSDDDEGITAVEAAGGEGVQLQRVQYAVVLTSCKHPEDGAAHMRLRRPQDSRPVRGRYVLESKQENVPGISQHVDLVSKLK